MTRPGVGLRGPRRYDDNGRKVAPQFVLAGAAIVTACGLLTLGETLVPVVLIGLSYAAAWSSRTALKTLAVVSVLLFVSPALAPDTKTVALWRWAPILVAWSRIYIDVALQRRITGSSVGVLLFAVPVACLGLVVSRAPVLSFLRAMTFACGSIAILMGWHFARRRWPEIRDFTAGVVGTVVVGSLPLLFLGEIGRQQNGVQFQGFLSHPQVFGEFLAPGLLVVMSRVRDRGIGRSLPELGIIIIGTVELLLAHSRTALFAFLLGVGVWGVASLFEIARWWAVRPRARRAAVVGVKSVTAAAAVGLIGAVIGWTSPELVRNAKTYVYKSEGDYPSSLAELFASRAPLIEAELQSFRDHPWTGIGFGVSSDAAQGGSVTASVLDVPVAAPVEKGVILFALLEETGLPGLLLFTAMVGALLAPLVGSVRLAIVTGALGLGVGDTVIFAMGGLGLWVWLCIGCAISMPPRRMQPKSKYNLRYRRSRS